MAELLGVDSHTITYHLKEIYKTGELEETANARKIRVVQKEGNRGSLDPSLALQCLQTAKIFLVDLFFSKIKHALPPTSSRNFTSVLFNLIAVLPYLHLTILFLSV